MKSPALPITGGCQCGAVRYAVSVAPTMLYCCHCNECQKQSSSAFGMSLIVDSAGFRLTRGETKVWSRPTDSGNTTDCHFCADCGSRIYHISAQDLEGLSIKAGSLDDRAWLKPGANIWTKRAQPWLHLPADLPNYAGEPEEER